MSIEKAQRDSRIPLNLVILGMWILFFHEVLKSFGIIVMYVAYSGFFILFSALLIALKKRYLSLLYGKYQLWIISIWIFASFILLYGILKSHSLQFLSRDIWPYSYFACLLVATRINTWRAIDKMIYQQFFIGLIVFLYILSTMDVSMLTRTVYDSSAVPWGTFNIYWAWGLMYGWMYMFLTFNKKQPAFRKIVTLLGIIFFLVFGIMMLKRQVIVELSMISFLKLIYEKKKTNFIKWTILFFIIITTVFSIIRFSESHVNTEYFKKLILRSKESGSVLATILSNTRLSKQPRDIYNQASDFEILFGQGLGSSVVKDGVRDTVVESGLFTTFLKGGIVYLIIWYLGFFSILKDTFLKRKKDKLLFGLLSTIFIISSPMGPFFISYFSTGYIMFWLGRCTSRE